MKKPNFNQLSNFLDDLDKVLTKHYSQNWEHRLWPNIENDGVVLKVFVWPDAVLDKETIQSKVSNELQMEMLRKTGKSEIEDIISTYKDWDKHNEEDRRN